MPRRVTGLLSRYKEWDDGAKHHLDLLEVELHQVDIDMFFSKGQS